MMALLYDLAFEESLSGLEGLALGMTPRMARREPAIRLISSRSPIAVRSHGRR
jgi:hypothetical protein